MPKRVVSKHVGDIRKELYRAAKYQWEFKRRNEAYRLWWQQGAKAKVKPKGWDENFDPDIPFDELINSVFSKTIANLKNTELKKIAEKYQSSVQKTFEFNFFQNLVTKGVELNLRPPYLILKINYSAVKNKKALRDYVAFLIEDMYGLYLAGDLIPNDPKIDFAKSLNLSRDFDKIIRAGDLKRNGETYAQIAKKMFPKTFKGAPDATIRNIKRFVKVYNNLVGKGYIGITFP